MALSLLSADSGTLTFGVPQWGIFKSSGVPVLTVNSVDSVEYARDYQISDYPQEKGAFESYNKVQVPYRAKVGFLISSTRTDFLNAVEDAVKSLDLVSVYTPEKAYESANLTHYSYRREARAGVTMIRVDVWCEEVRIVAGAKFEDAKSTNAAPASESGQVQPIDTTQRPPVATDTNVGGGFTTADRPSDNFTGGGGVSAVRTTEQFFTTEGVAVPLNDPNTTIPPGIPNSTGGTASSQTVPTADIADFSFQQIF